MFAMIATQKVIVMIVGGRVTEINGVQGTGKEMKGLSVNIGINNVRINSKGIEFDYSYGVLYEGDLGSLTIKGTLFAEESKDLTEQIKSEWTKSKKLPEEYAKGLMNIIIRSGTSNGILIARVLDLPPPLPPLQIGKIGKLEDK